MMKRIIDGKTYNTETATKIAEEWFDSQKYGADLEWNQLFQTRHGAYFCYTGHELFENSDNITPFPPEEAQEWMEKHSSTELIEHHFGEMPEAGDSESRFTLRMPDSLKQRIDACAKAQKQSTNAWIVRSLEKSANEQLHGGDNE